MSTSASASPQPGGLVVTRFAPSPTGDLHLGNARTALFNLLLARRTGGRLLLRIEDTDSERSLEAHTQGLMADLRWLGIAWDAGPDREDERGPYRQSQRAPLYAQDLAALERAGAVYPCFCTALELELSRRAQLTAGRPATGAPAASSPRPSAPGASPPVCPRRCAFACHRASASPSWTWCTDRRAS